MAKEEGSVTGELKEGVTGALMEATLIASKMPAVAVLIVLQIDGESPGIFWFARSESERLGLAHQAVLRTTQTVINPSLCDEEDEGTPK